MSINELEISITTAEETDIDEIINVLERRIKWMDEHGIRQWVNGYTQRYNREYFIRKINSGDNCYIARSYGEMVGVIMLEKESYLFSEAATGDTGYYIKHFASVRKGAGALLLEHAYKISEKSGKKSIYTNCNSLNPRLVQYFKDEGFSVIGKGIIYDTYHYYLLEKKIKMEEKEA